MSVTDTNPHYDKSLIDWQLVRDCVDGARAVKARIGGGKLRPGTLYLPMPSPEDESMENLLRYDDYKLRALFVGFTAMTREGLVQMPFRLPLAADLDPSIEYLSGSTDGGNITLEQLAKSTLGEDLEVGRAGLLVDYQAAEEGLTQAQVAAMGLRANILRYRAEDILNWRTENIGGMKMLVLVVLREVVDIVAADGFGITEEYQYRVLMLEDGVYTAAIYSENGTPSAEWIPTDFSGSTWAEIPFQFIGAKDNDETIDKAPLYDIAQVNIAHYRNSADYEESSYIVGQPTPYAAGLTQNWVDNVLGGKLAFGSRGGIMLPEGGSAGLIQAQPNSMPMEGMQEKESQAIKLGARIIVDSAGSETLGAAKIRFSGQNSKLASIVENVESGINQCLEWAGRFMGAASESTIIINRKFYDDDIDPQEIIASIQLLDRGVIAMTDLRANLRKADKIAATRTDEDIDSEADILDPLAITSGTI